MICVPFLRVVYWMGDEGVLLDGASRLIQGDRLYADFFEFLPPGGFVITQVWLSLFGQSMSSARVLAILTLLGIAGFTYLACRAVSRSTIPAAFLTLLWTVTSQGVQTQVSHHWLTTLFSMIAAWAALAAGPRAGVRWPIIAGLACGAAGMVTPTRGALVCLAASAAFIGRSRFPSLFQFVLATAVVPLGLVLYLASHGLFGPAYDDVIRFAAGQYASIQTVPFGSSAQDQNRPLAYLFQGTLAVAVLSCFLKGSWREDRRFWICIGFGAAGFGGCFPRPDMWHIAFAAPMVLPLLACAVSRMLDRLPIGGQWALAAAALAIGVLPARSLELRALQALHTPTIAVARGVIAPRDSAGMRELLAHVAAMPPRERVFFYPYEPLLPFLTGRPQVSRYDLFVPWYTIPAQYQEACQSVMREADWLVLDRAWSDPKQLAGVFPAMKRQLPPEMVAFEQALDSGFDFVSRDGALEVRKRNPAANAALCADIAGR
ncbi:MAG: hypothetical protein JOZ05_23905 [Acetobacteraceae bacterium]|nr:hypothetical protein [Acetobacteraceae bacterium]